MKRTQLSDCDGCSSEQRWHLHNIKHRGSFRRFCTSCVLRNNSGSFCSVCFQVFEDLSSLPDDRVYCLKCPSIAHRDCAKDKDASNSTLYLCPPCSNPNFSFFDVDSSTSNKKNKSELGLVENQRREIDERLAKVLVAAAQIAFFSISKAAEATKLEADIRLKEAAFVRKGVKEAMGKLAIAWAKPKVVDKENEKSRKVVAGVNNPNPNPNPNPNTSPGPSADKKKKAKTVSAVAAAVSVQKRSHEQSKEEENGKFGKTIVKNDGDRFGGKKFTTVNNSQNHVVKEDKGNSGVPSQNSHATM